MGAKSKIKKYINDWEQKGYHNGIPDEAPTELEKRGLVPSYRLICIAIMKNPNNLEILGFPREKCNIYQEIKREEIYNRPTKNKQLKLFL
jgi:predicted phosphoadenosine phosphosulfate sulfurtransferase